MMKTLISSSFAHCAFSTPIPCRLRQPLIITIIMHDCSEVLKTSRILLHHVAPRNLRTFSSLSPHSFHTLSTLLPHPLPLYYCNLLTIFLPLPLFSSLSPTIMILLAHSSLTHCPSYHSCPTAAFTTETVFGLQCTNQKYTQETILTLSLKVHPSFLHPLDFIYLSISLCCFVVPPTASAVQYLLFPPIRLCYY